MTETLTALTLDRNTYPDQLMMMQIITNVYGSVVWNFEFPSLEFVWNLVFDAWNFHDLH
jgi:hypothetical protein